MEWLEEDINRMIKLAEILHTIRHENQEGLTVLDRWNILHAEFLENMDFKADGMYHYSLHAPHIRVSHKKNDGFVVEDFSHKKKHTFKTFKELENFFTTYKQKWTDAPETGTSEEDDEEESPSNTPTK
jgi:hypothetical protein